MKRRALKVICWDLDQTLIATQSAGRGKPIPKIRPLIEALEAKQVQNVITTASSGGHAKDILESSGLGRLFGPIFEREDICDRMKNKSYLPVARSLGISEADAPHRLLVVGDNITDAGADIDLTFILHRMSEHCTADVYTVILGELMGLSDSWSDAHAMMRSLARESYHMDYEFTGALYSKAGILLAVGMSLLDRGPLAPVNRLIEVLSVPSFLKV